MVKKIFWDKGHGGADPGACGNGLRESDLTHAIVEYAMGYMNANYSGFEQRTSRAGDQTVPLGQRDDLADNWGADIFISVHINAGGGTGFESYVYNGGVDAQTLALQKVLNDEILAAMRQFGNIQAHGGAAARQDNFSVLRETNMPAVLTENLFIDSNDAQYLKNTAFLQAVGEAHARAAAKHLGLPAQSPKQFFFYTGGYSGEGLAKIHSYLMGKGLGFTPSRGREGHLFFTVGPFQETAASADVEGFLKENGYWYSKQQG
ncbi:N-acetylmuramoyl-L-alanine amidase family protein [Ectobacillus ponti]|uniref:N-acetylmuramoyl-L-alanine amidase n=1 Tax=Ectobacillus ponti TaxID=2961894 RepID=A0AA41XAS4_9BACI|nr:N-acetylmuramoyl-L-alanine amidase [Ectobacillus ponti]MCP8970055.1 N-acetylmuramoyl-L-alanine amidase [Ectobacillus ponti]